MACVAPSGGGPRSSEVSPEPPDLRVHEPVPRAAPRTRRARPPSRPACGSRRMGRSTEHGDAPSPSSRRPSLAAGHARARSGSPLDERCGPRSRTPVALRTDPDQRLGLAVDDTRGPMRVSSARRPDRCCRRLGAPRSDPPECWTLLITVAIPESGVRVSDRTLRETMGDTGTRDGARRRTAVDGASRATR